MPKLIISAVFAAIGIFIALGAAQKAGMINGLFTDEAELRRVDVELQRVIQDHEERKILIAAATEPRTPGFIVFLMILMAGICGALFVMVMRYREQVRFAEYKMQITGNPNRKELPEPSGLVFQDQRDVERGQYV